MKPGPQNPENRRKGHRRQIERRKPKPGVTVRHGDNKDLPKRIRRATRGVCELCGGDHVAETVDIGSGFTARSCPNVVQPCNEWYAQDGVDFYNDSGKEPWTVWP